MRRKLYIHAEKIDELVRAAINANPRPWAKGVNFAKFQGRLHQNLKLSAKTVCCGLYRENSSDTSSTMTYEIVRWDWDSLNNHADHLNVDSEYISVVSGGTAEITNVLKSKIPDHYSIGLPARYTFCGTGGGQPTF